MEDDPPSSEEEEAVPIKSEPSDDEFDFHQELEPFGEAHFGKQNQ